MSNLCSLPLPAGNHEEVSVLCDKALDYLEAGLTMIKTHFQSASLEEQEAIIEETEQMLMMTVAIESLLATASEDGNRDGVVSAAVLPHMRISPICVYSYRTPIRVWDSILSHTNTI